MHKRIGHIHVITDETIQSRFSHVELAELAIAGGADTIQYRDKTRSTEELVEMAHRILEVCGVPLIINDHIDVAQALGADGVHLGAGDVSVSDARAMLGDDAIIGASASTLDAACAAADEGADYIGCGHVFETSSKQKGTAPIGLDGLHEVCEAVDVPVIAVGGITHANVSGVMEAGAWGVALIGAVCAADDPKDATRLFFDVVDSFKSI